MNSVPLQTGAAFDLRTLDSLKRTSREDPQAALKEAAKQMEGMFVQMMLKSMREASFKDGLFNTQQTEMFTSMYDQQIAQDIAGKGNLGLADMMLKQMGVEPEKGQSVTATAAIPLSLDTASFKPAYTRHSRSHNPNCRVSLRGRVLQIRALKAAALYLVYFHRPLKHLKKRHPSSIDNCSGCT